ncbi:MAG: hypothetical protein VB089_17830 [Anaerolineaceae bacterium]|nr:hypothetical protein [Anaerolineaceae bacterium]
MNHPDVLSPDREPQAPQAGAQFLPPSLLAASLLAGTALSLLVLPGWLTGLARSLQGEQPTVFWLLSRASALVSFGLLWLSMALGLLITGKTARLWPGSATTFDLHEHTSLLGLIFGLLHALLLLGDQYIHFDAVQIVLPFASLVHNPAR